MCEAVSIFQLVDKKIYFEVGELNICRSSSHPVGGEGGAEEVYLQSLQLIVFVSLIVRALDSRS